MDNVSHSIKDSKSFDYKTSITGKLQGIYKKCLYQIVVLLKIVVPLKYLSNFWRTLDIPLINCEVSLTLTWSANCVIQTEYI